MTCTCGADYRIPSAWTVFTCAACAEIWTRKHSWTGYAIWEAKVGKVHKEETTGNILQIR